MKYKFLEKFDLNELNELKLIVNNTDRVAGLIMEINKLIMINSTNINNLILLNQLCFSEDSKKIFLENGISTVQDLICCDISSLKGIDSITKEEISWGKDFYDFSNVSFVKKKCERSKK